MAPAVRSLIEALHRGQVKYVLALTGGGASAAAHLLTVPGGSRTILEVVVPYHEQALNDFLGRPPEQYCSVECGRALARRAYERAGWLTPREAVAGLGCTATLATDRPKKGDHRFHLSYRTSQRLVSHTLTFEKGARDRAGEEAVVAAVLLNALADVQGIPERLDLHLRPGEALQTEATPSAEVLNAFLQGERKALCVEVGGRLCPEAPEPAALLPGSFNPLHEGHWELAAVAAKRTGLPVAFELSAANVDKATLSVDEIVHRLRPLCWRAPVWLTRAPTFAEKADLFPGAVFIVGADTALRIIAPQYYQDSEVQMLAALERIRAQGCRFIVAGRLHHNGQFLRVEDLPLPESCRALFQGIPESEYRFDVSSTVLRDQS
ncbi:MAG: hypothetical protein JNM56_34495 [Planctomycetia bacterium]|nr:hypothetical protein [Planctomycetia bacterium]